MDTKKLVEHFSYVFSAENGIENIRKLILNLAIQGRLVNQIPYDGSVQNLVQELKNIRTNLSNKGKIKKSITGDVVENHEMAFPIPGPWTWVRLKDLGTIIGGGTPRTSNQEYFAQDGMPWVTPADLSNLPGKYILRGRRDLSELGLANSSARLLPKGTVLFSSRAPIGYVAIAANPLATNQGFKSCVPFIAELSDYIYYYLMAVSDELEQNATGTTFKEVSGKIVGQIPVSLPPLAEQKRIVAKIEELMALCDQLENQKIEASKITIKARDRSLDILTGAKTFSDLPVAWQRIETNFAGFFSPPKSIDTLRGFIYDMACTGRLSNKVSSITPVKKTLGEVKKIRQELLRQNEIKLPNRLFSISEIEEPTVLPVNWQWVRLGELCKAIEYGTSEKAHEALNGVPVLRMGNIVNGKIEFDDLKYVDQDIKDLPRLLLKYGDLLFNRTNSYELVGKMGIFLQEDDTYTFASYLIRVTLFDQYILPEWVNLFFQSSICRKTQIEPQITAQTNQANFNGSKLANVMIPLAPIEEQRDIIKRIKAYLQMCDDLERQIIKKEERQNSYVYSAIQLIIKPESVARKLDTRKEPRTLEKVLSVIIGLVSDMTNNFENSRLAQILKKNGGKMEAKELWKASNLKEIDEFYAILKQEIEADFIQEPAIAEIKLVEIMDYADQAT